MKVDCNRAFHDFEEKTVVVAGGMGFIGSALCRRLLSLQAKVICVDNMNDRCGGNPRNICDIESRIRVVRADVSDAAVMSEVMEGADVLFNMVGKTSHLESLSDPLGDLSANGTAQLALLETCRRVQRDVRIVFAGTRQVFGVPNSLPVDESHPLVPVDINGVNKLCAEMYHKLYSALHGMSTTVLRLTNTYGPGMVVRDARQTFLGLWIRRILEGQDVVIYGTGLQVRDLNYVDDVVDALLLAALSADACGKVYNLGGLDVLSLNELADILISEAGGGSVRKEDFPELLHHIDIGDYYGDYSLIQEELGWRPATSITDGVSRTVAYFRDNLEFYTE